MAIRKYFEVLSRRGSYRNLLSLAKEAVDSNTVNDVLVAVVAADKAYKAGVGDPDACLGIAYKAGFKVGRVFEKEAERVLKREHQANPEIIKAFEREAFRTQNGTGLKYSRENDRALILQGDYLIHVDNGNEFKAFLIDGIGYRPENVFDLFTMSNGDPPKTSELLKESSKTVVKAAGKFGNIVVYYSGCGGRGHFSFGPDEIGYENWCKPFSKNAGNIAFVIDTAKASSLKEPLTDNRALPGRCMLLSGAMDEESRGNRFSREVMSAYSTGKAYRPKDIEVPCPGTEAVDVLKGFLSTIGVQVVETPEPKKDHKHYQKPERFGPDLDYLLLNFNAPGME